MTALGLPASGPVLTVSRKPEFAACCAKQGLLTPTRAVTARTTAEAFRQAGRTDMTATIIDLAFMEAGIDGLELALNIKDANPALRIWLADTEDIRGFMFFPLHQVLRRRARDAR